MKVPHSLTTSASQIRLKFTWGDVNIYILIVLNRTEKREQSDETLSTDKDKRSHFFTVFKSQDSKRESQPTPPWSDA